jgi:hypothetical protein
MAGRAIYFVCMSLASSVQLVRSATTIEEINEAFIENAKHGDGPQFQQYQVDTSLPEVVARCSPEIVKYVLTPARACVRV